MTEYKLKFEKLADKDIEKLYKSDPKAFKKLGQLTKELRIHPRTGTGQPERLRGYGEREIYSRRITHKHRLKYEIEDNIVTVTIIQALGHYDDK